MNEFRCTKEDIKVIFNLNVQGWENWKLYLWESLNKTTKILKSMQKPANRIKKSILEKSIHGHACSIYNNHMNISDDKTWSMKIYFDNLQQVILIIATF